MRPRRLCPGTFGAGLAAALVAAMVSGCGSQPDTVPVIQAAPTSGDLATVTETLLEAVQPGADSREVIARSVTFSPLLDPDGVMDVLGRVADLGPWEVVERVAGETEADFVLRSRAGRSMTFHVSVDESGTVNSLWFGHAVDRGRLAEDRDALRREIDTVPASSAVAVWDVTGGTCVAVEHRGGRGQVLPLASVSKLYVVAAAVMAVEAGRSRWDDELSLAAGLRSLPPGKLASAPDGMSLTLAEAVSAAVTDSDNTAADLAAHHVGLGAVEEARDVIGGATDRGPFWTTREAFELGWGEGARPGTAVPEGADLSAARSDLAGRALTATTVAITVPRWMDGVDWFATSDELCALGRWLHEHWTSLPATLGGPPVSRALGHAVPEGTLLWKHGGSPGVATALGLVEDDGRRYVVTAQFASERPTDVADARGLHDLVARFGAVNGDSRRRRPEGQNPR